MMRRVVYEFLNLRFKGRVIWCQKHELSDKIIEKYMTDDYEGIIDFTRFYNNKDVRYRVNSLLRGHIKKYMDIDNIDIEMYVLGWCKDKAVIVNEFEYSR